MGFLLRKSGYLVAVAFLGLCAFVILRGPQGMPSLVEKRKEIQAMQELNADLQNQIEKKRARIERLKTSEAEQELEIRERLKLLRKGETRFITPEAPASSAQ
jgi:cell division protein FtsB